VIGLQHEAPIVWYTFFGSMVGERHAVVAMLHDEAGRFVGWLTARGIDITTMVEIKKSFIALCLYVWDAFIWSARQCL
jgi:hypothetical protein